jgi:uncharacterized protein (TIGR03437 family)
VAACSPGAIAAIEGRWLANGAAASDASGNSHELAGTKVWANGVLIPVLSASTAELRVLCPDSIPGSELQFVVQTDHGMAEPIRTTARSAAPGIFSLDGTGAGQGWVLLEGTESVAMVRNYRLASQPAIPGDQVVFYATGIEGLANVKVSIGTSQVALTAINPVPERPGLFRGAISVPVSMIKDGDFPFSLSGIVREGTMASSNIVSIAVELNTR